MECRSVSFRCMRTRTSSWSSSVRYRNFLAHTSTRTQRQLLSKYTTTFPMCAASVAADVAARWLLALLPLRRSHCHCHCLCLRCCAARSPRLLFKCCYLCLLKRMRDDSDSDNDEATSATTTSTPSPTTPTTRTAKQLNERSAQKKR